MDLNIGLHSLKVANLFVSKRREGWAIEVMPGMVWNAEEERWVLEPPENSDQYDDYLESCLFPLEKAIDTAIKLSTDGEASDKEDKGFDEDEDEDDEDLEEEIERECQACQKESLGNICRVALQADFPLPRDNSLGDHILGRASFTGPFFLCKDCFLDFLNYYLENHTGKKEKTLKEDLNFIIDLLHNDKPLIGVQRKDVQKLLTTMARIYYPMLAWTQLKADGEDLP